MTVLGSILFPMCDILFPPPLLQRVAEPWPQKLAFSIDECEAQMAVDAIPPGGKVLQTVSGHSNAFMQITDTQIWKVRPTPGAVPGGLSPAGARFAHPPCP